jgi:ribosomal protein S18 acetylase RimI-like enzyme
LSEELFMRADAATGSSLRLRPMRWPEDEPFLERVYASTRADELAQVEWSAEQKAAFCRMQFAAQHQYYQEQYAGADFDVIELQGVPIGRLYVNRGQREIRIIDISLLPEHRGRGLGTQLLRGLQGEAREGGQVLTIHAEKFNPSLRLYQRLGFEVQEDRGVYLFMQWAAPDD